MTDQKVNVQESTLTTPCDRDPNRTFRLEQNAPSLTDEQLNTALKELNNNRTINNYPRLERRYLDPPIDGQKIGLISFVPAKGATPNEQGIYGFAKLRGNYGTDIEANERAEYIIRNVDSYHTIYHTLIGRPFPLTTTSAFSQESHKVDLKEQITKSVSDDIKNKREQEQREIKEIKEREKQLLEDVKKNPEENLDDHYTSLRLKKAQLVWTYSETKKKLEQMVGLIAKCKHDIEELDAKDSTLQEKYMEKYMEARKQAGLPVDRDVLANSFMKYMVEDLDLPEVDIEYNRLYNSNN